MLPLKASVKTHLRLKILNVHQSLTLDNTHVIFNNKSTNSGLPLQGAWWLFLLSESLWVTRANLFSLGLMNWTACQVVFIRTFARPGEIGWQRFEIWVGNLLVMSILGRRWVSTMSRVLRWRLEDAVLVFSQFAISVWFNLDWITGSAIQCHAKCTNATQLKGKCN